jgi:hypothetical protein
MYRTQHGERAQMASAILRMMLVVHVERRLCDADCAADAVQPTTEMMRGGRARAHAQSR